MRRMNGWRNSILAGFLLAGCVAQAGFLNRVNPFRKWSRKIRVETLIVTGNYGRSRLLAELAQYKTKQPIVLVEPAMSGRQAQLFFMPSAPEAMAFADGKYREFIEYLQPGRIVFLGDNTFVPERYVDQVRDTYPTVVLNSTDWVKNAAALAVILNYKKLPKHYGGYLEKLEAAAGGRAVEAGALAAPATAPEPMMSPQLLAPVEEPTN